MKKTTGTDRSITSKWRPASTTHANMGEDARQEMGIGQGMLRINVGLEDPLDVIEDLAQAFDKSGL